MTNRELFQATMDFANEGRLPNFEYGLNEGVHGDGHDPALP